MACQTMLTGMKVSITGTQNSHAGVGNSWKLKSDWAHFFRYSNDSGQTSTITQLPYTVTNRNNREIERDPSMHGDMCPLVAEN